MPAGVAGVLPTMEVSYADTHIPHFHGRVIRPIETKNLGSDHGDTASTAKSLRLKRFRAPPVG